MKFILNLYVFCFFGSALIFAQTNFNSHVVAKGENVYRISLKYNVTMDAIFEANPGSDKGVEVGQTLKIPTSSHATLYSQSDNAEEYTVVEGDTKYSLAKKYGMSIATFEKINPNTVPELIAGDIIKTSINNNSTNTPVNVEAEKVVISESVTSEKPLNAPSNLNIKNKSGFIDYVIKPNETLYGLSKRAEMSINEFLKLNPQLSDNVLSGTIIKMPNTGELNVSNIKNDSEIVAPAPKLNISTQIFWDNNIANTSNQSEFINNYKIGMQMAIDSIKRTIPNAKLEISDTLDRNFTESVDSINSNSKFIVQPLILKNDSTNYLSISTLLNGKQTSINYLGLAEESEMRNSVIKYLNKNDGNNIFIYDKEKSDIKDFVESQITNLKTIRVNNKGIFNNQDLIDYLVTNSKNYVIIESSRDGVFLSATNTLLKQLANYNIELVVLNEKYIPEDNKVSSKRFRILKLIYPSSFSTSFYSQKKKLLKTYTKNVSQNDSNDIAFGFGMVYNALYQIYFSDFKNYTDYNFNSQGIPMEYDHINSQFINKTVYIYRYEENSDTFLLETYK